MQRVINYNMRFQIVQVQRNNTYETSGPCTDTSIETNDYKNAETKPIDSFELKASELNPFGPTVK